MSLCPTDLFGLACGVLAILAMGFLAGYASRNCECKEDE